MRNELTRQDASVVDFQYAGAVDLDFNNTNFCVADSDRVQTPVLSVIELAGGGLRCHSQKRRRTLSSVLADPVHCRRRFYRLRHTRLTGGFHR